MFYVQTREVTVIAELVFHIRLQSLLSPQVRQDSTNDPDKLSHFHKMSRRMIWSKFRKKGTLKKKFRSWIRLYTWQVSSRHLFNVLINFVRHSVCGLVSGSTSRLSTINLGQSQSQFVKFLKTFPADDEKKLLIWN